MIGSGIAFTSNIDMASGNLQVRSGTLIYPQTAEYDSEYGGSHTFSGDQEYQRYFYKTSASTGALTFTGFTASNISPYGTGSVNVLLYLEGDDKYFDLGVLQGSNSNNGSTRALAISAKTSASSGALNWSLGVFTTGVSGAGSSLMLSVYGSDQYIAQYEEELGKPWENPKKWEALSYPFFRVKEIKAPVLFMASQADFNVPVIGAEQMYQAFKSEGIPTELIIYPNQNHGIRVPSYIVHRHNAHINWFNKYLK